MDNGIWIWNDIPKPSIGPSSPHNFGKLHGENCNKTPNGTSSLSDSLAQQHDTNYLQTALSNGSLRQGQHPATPSHVLFCVSQRKQQKQQPWNSALPLNGCYSNVSNNHQYLSNSNGGCASKLSDKPNQDVSKLSSSGQILALCATRLHEAHVKAPPTRAGNISHQESQSTSISQQNLQFHPDQHQTQHQKKFHNSQKLCIIRYLRPMGPPSPARGSKLLSKMNPTKKQHQLFHKHALKKFKDSLRMKRLKILHSMSGQRKNNPSTNGFQLDIMLQKLIEYIGQTKLETEKLTKGIEAHRKEVQDLLGNIKSCKSMIPAIPVPVLDRKTKNVEEMFDQWILHRTHENWKFGIFSIVVRVLFNSYNESVSTASEDDMWRTMRIWIDQRCTFEQLTPMVLEALFYVCTKMDSLTNIRNLPQVACKAITLDWK